MTREAAVQFLSRKPYKLGHMLGFDRLTPLHNSWILDMVNATSDKTLQAHRGSYKTTCVSIALCVIMILHPDRRVLFMRKTDTDVKEIIAQVKKILESPQVRYIAECIWGVRLTLIKASSVELSTSLMGDIKGAAQLTGRGIGGSITGKHYDLIFTDDIVNVEDTLPGRSGSGQNWYIRSCRISKTGADGFLTPGRHGIRMMLSC